MDAISHAAWGATIIRKSPQVWWAAFFGALPDILPFLFGVLRFKKTYIKKLTEMGRSEHTEDPYFKVYHFFHSFIPITIVTVILYFLTPSSWFITIPYYLHIIMDVFTHRGVWATRIFYPFSDFHFEGWNWWQNKWITIGNWTALAVINLIIFVF